MTARLLLHKLDTMRRMTWRDSLLLVEAVALLALARLIVIIVPFRFVARLLARMPQSGRSDEMLIRRIAWAVRLGARNVPWRAVCLPQAMAAMVMLARRGCASSLHVGAGRVPDGGLIAHAWLMSDCTIVIGEAGIDQVAPLLRVG
jgi:hypothetical protein